MLDSTTILEQIIGCNALLRTPCSEATQTRVVQLLRGLCQKTLISDSVYPPNLLLAFFKLPIGLITADEVFREFAYRMVQSDTANRINCLLVLERLAFHNDAKAKELLARSVNDSEEQVRDGAKNCLERLANGIDVEQMLF